MAHMRSEQGDAIMLDLWPFAPKTYLLMGKEANRDVLEGLDPSLEQILQELINVLPVSAKVPSEVDVALQRKVASLFQSEKIVNARLPIFAASAQQMQQRWSGLPAGSELNIFCELSEYVLLADLEVIYGKTFREAHGDAIIAEFAQWVDNIAKGNSPIGFFKALGELLKETMADMQVRPELYVDERSVLGVYLESGALERHDEEALVGLLSMTLMAAVFNTQVSLAWVLVHLYDDPELLRRARDEIASCPDLNDYTQLEQLPFLNSCIDEAVRLHTMLPGNTVLRKTKRDVTLGSHTVEAGSVLWLYPNAVHLDEKVFPQPTAFCPMRLLNGNLERMTADFELVTFGHGQKRCIGEKMARAMIISFLGNALPAIDAAAPDDLPKDGFFDLIPASELRLLDVRARAPPATAATPGAGATAPGVSSVAPTRASAAKGRAPTPGMQMSSVPPELPEVPWEWVAQNTKAAFLYAHLHRERNTPGTWLATAADVGSDWARNASREVSKSAGHIGRLVLWEVWLAGWRAWTTLTTTARLQTTMAKGGLDEAAEAAEQAAREVALIGRKLRWELWLMAWRAWTGHGSRAEREATREAGSRRRG